jgi:hypothetical protein
MTAEKSSNFSLLYILFHLESFHYLDESFSNPSENSHDTLENKVM